MFSSVETAWKNNGRQLLFPWKLDIERGASVSEPGKTGEALNRMAEGNVGCWILTFDPVALLGKSSRNTAYLREGLRY